MRGALGRVIPSPSFDYGPATPDPSLRNPLPTGEGKICQAALRTSATIFFAASPRSLAGTIASPELARISLPLWTLVPSSRTTSGTDRFTYRSDERRVGNAGVSTGRYRW